MAKTLEQKHADFLRLMAPRLGKATHAIGLLAGLSRKGDYAYTQAEVQNMLDLLDDAVDAVATAFGVQPAEAAPAPSQPVRVAGGPVPGRDRRDIREALRVIHDGDIREGVKALDRIVLGWVVPDEVD